GGRDFSLDDPVAAEPLVAESRAVAEEAAPADAYDDDPEDESGALGVDDELAALEAELAKPKRKPTEPRSGTTRTGKLKPTTTPSQRPAPTPPRAAGPEGS